MNYDTVSILHLFSLGGKTKGQQNPASQSVARASEKTSVYKAPLPTFSKGVNYNSQDSDSSGSPPFSPIGVTTACINSAVDEEEKEETEDEDTDEKDTDEENEEHNDEDRRRRRKRRRQRGRKRRRNK